MGVEAVRMSGVRVAMGRIMMPMRLESTKSDSAYFLVLLQWCLGLGLSYNSMAKVVWRSNGKARYPQCYYYTPSDYRYLQILTVPTKSTDVPHLLMSPTFQLLK